ncbi:MAG: NAD-dependent epimerase/dehydratase family protein [Pseudomonadota bacterium]
MINDKMIAVTGANGFVGQAVCRELMRQGFGVRALLRRESTRRDMEQVLAADARVVGDIEDTTNFGDTLNGVGGVVHLAARVHVMTDHEADPLTAFRRVNVGGSIALAKAASSYGVKRMVFMSSVKVNGEETRLSPFDETSPFQPDDPYGQSKVEAEKELHDFARKNGIGLTVLRPPLVYGPGVKANFAAMMKLAALGVPLPFGAIDNRRSLIHVDNLASACVQVLQNPAAEDKTFMVSDGEDFSVPDMIRYLAEGMMKKSRMIPVPISWLKILGRLSGKQAQISRLTGSLQIDSRLIRKELNWQPPVNGREGLRLTGKWFLNQTGR